MEKKMENEMEKVQPPSLLEHWLAWMSASEGMCMTW